MFKILRLPSVSRPLSLIILFSFMTMVNGCYYFKVTRSADPAQTTISKMQDEQKSIILHLADKAWQFKNIIIDDEYVSGSISGLSKQVRERVVKPDASNRYFKRTSRNETYLLNEVHIYVSEYSENADGKISVPLSAIQKIEIYDKDKGATIASWIFSGIGVAAGAFAVIGIIVALTKSSCPFVYTYDGNEFHFSGEIFSGATQPGLERDDYLPLYSLAPEKGTYKLKLTNEVHEIQSVNHAKLLVIDHSGDFSVLIDKYGKLLTFKQPSSPVMAKNSSGKDILPSILTKDTLFYSGDVKGIGKNGIEEIVMKFIKPETGGSAKLIIRAKNSLWFDVLFTRFHNLFGERYNTFSEKQESASGKKLNKFLLDQNIPLSVYLERDGKWKFVDYFNIAGPMALRDDILPLNLDGINSDTIKIKLETGFLFWELDYASVDFSKNETVIPATLSANSAIDKNEGSVSDLLLLKDKNYLVLKEVGDEVLLSFDAPVRKNTERTVFLHTSGYYKILREQSGAPDKKALKTFKKPNRFPEFSKEMYDLLPAK